MKTLRLISLVAALLITFSACTKNDAPELADHTDAVILPVETNDIQMGDNTRTPQTEGDSTEINYIWDITDPVEFCLELSWHLEEKCNFGEYIDRLNEHERIIYIVLILDMEVNNGGFNQYFFNSSGNFAGEIVGAFEAIGAPKTAQICQRAIDAFGCDVPADRFARQELLEQLEGTEFDDILDECDNAFYDYEEDLYDLYYAYVMAHRDAFS